jgi:hypothetical protein
VRALLTLAFLTATSTAGLSDPKAGSAAKRPGTKSASTTSELERSRSDAHAARGRDIIVPAPMTDALPYPRGMVIAPPDVGDRMVLIRPPPAWGSLWWRIERVVDAIWSALQPPHL